MEWLTKLARNQQVRAALLTLLAALSGALLGPPLGVPDAPQVVERVQSAL